MNRKIYLLTKGDIIIFSGDISSISNKTGFSQTRLKSYLNKPKYLDAYSLNLLK